MFTKIIRFFPALQWMEILFVAIVVITVFGVSGSLKSCIEDKLGLETKQSLKEKTIVQEATIKQITNTNVDLVNAMELKKKSEAIDTTVVVEKFKEVAVVEKKYNDIKTKKVDKIQVIKKEFETKPITVINTQEEEKQISTVQINSLWELYCSDSSSQCKSGISSPAPPV